MIKTIRLTDDIGAVVPCVKMVCDCGWIEKAFRQEAKKRASAHLKGQHNGGLMAYMGETELV